MSEKPGNQTPNTPDASESELSNFFRWESP